MNEAAFKARTKCLALQIMQVVDGLPRRRATDVIGRQLIRSATSVAANYRAACRGKSKADVVAKLGIVKEEADESMLWMELLIESKTVSSQTMEPLHQEMNEIVAMTVASIKTLRGRS